MGLLVVLNGGQGEVEDVVGATGRYGEPGEEGGRRGAWGGRVDQGKVEGARGSQGEAMAAYFLWLHNL